MFLEDKFVVISLTEKVKSYLLPDLTAKDRQENTVFTWTIGCRCNATIDDLSQPEVRDGQAPQVFFIAIYP